MHVVSVRLNRARLGRPVSLARQDQVRDALERYLRWREREVALRRLGELRLSVDAFVRRGSEILILKRRGGLGSDRWVLPGGVVEPREDLLLQLTPWNRAFLRLSDSPGVAEPGATAPRVLVLRDGERISSIGAGLPLS